MINLPKNIEEIAQSVAREYHHSSYSTGHLLWALFHDDSAISTTLQSAGQNVFYLKDWAKVFIEEHPKSGEKNPSPIPDKKVGGVLKEALNYKHYFLDADEDPPLAAILTAICKPNIGFSENDLKSLPLTPDKVIDIFGDVSVSLDTTTEELSPSKNGKKRTSKKGNTTLQKYCIDKLQEAKEGKSDTIVGREAEILKIAEMLGRRNTPNVLLLGEPGVGKSAIVEGFANEIIQKNLTSSLNEAQLFELDLGSLVAGASYKGEVENRLKKIIKEVQTKGNTILFIDEIHQLLDPKGSIGTGVANILKPELARGSLKVIGATTTEEYTKYLEKDKAFIRRFGKIKVAEPTPDIAAKMIGNVIPKYQDHHQVEVKDGALAETIAMAKRFYKDQFLPASAVGLLDQSMSALKILKESTTQELTTARTDLLTIIQNEEQRSEVAQRKELDWFYYRLQKRISPILWMQLTQDGMEEEMPLDTYQQYLLTLLDQAEKGAKERQPIITKEDITAMVAFNTGIPMGKLQSDEQEKLLNLEDTLRQRVKGQDHALKVVTDTLLDARSGLARAGRPKGAFFFVGPTGTGKTELAKTIAAFLFDSEEALIRFDMSEYKSKTDVNKMLGVASGYVGYEEGGILVNKIRQQPYSVVLFDELEKAHDDIYDIFLQILSDGRVTDNKGNLGDFSNAILIFTSNLGAHKIVETFETKNEIPSNDTLKEILASEDEFRPEMIGRLSESVELVPFAPISEEVAQLIFHVHLKKELTNNLSNMNMQLDITEEAAQAIVAKGYSKEYGARPILGVIRNELRKPISKLLIQGKYKAGDTIKVTYDSAAEEIIFN